MAQLMLCALFTFILLSTLPFTLSNSFPETCKKLDDDEEVNVLRNNKREDLDMRYLVLAPPSDDGVVLMKRFTEYIYSNIIGNLGAEFNEWHRLNNELKGIKFGVEEICENYDADYTKAFPYNCYTKENWCFMKEFFDHLIEQASATKPGENNWLRRWTGWFSPPPPDTHWAPVFEKEVTMVCQSFFHHSSLGSMTETAKQSRDSLKGKVIDLVNYYVRTNNIDNLKLFIERFTWVKEDFAQACQRDDGEFVCQMDRIFKGVQAMIQDTDTYEWNFESPPPRDREVLAMLWLVIPLNIRDMFPSIMDDEVARERVQRFLQMVFDSVVSKDEEKLESLMSHSTSLKERSKSDCNDPQNIDPGALECVFSNVSKHINDLVSVVKSENWGDQKALDMRSGILIGLMGTRTRDFIEFTQSQTREFVIDAFERIYHYAKQNDIEGLDQYTKSMPSTESLQRVPGQSCSEFFNDLKARIPCLFENTLREIFLFMNSQKKAPLNTKVISTQFDYKEELRSAQLASISTQIEQQTLEVKASLAEFTDEIKTFVSEETGRRFAALEDYFQGIADFDERKANADILFIAARLKGFDDQVKELQPDLETSLWNIINGSVLASAVDTIQRAAEVAVKSAFACNPLDPDPGAVIDSVNDLSQSIVNVVRSQTLKRLFEDVIKQTTSVGSKLAENTAFIQNVKTIVEDLPKQTGNEEAFTKKTTDFLDQYGLYDPKVQSQEIAEMGANWEAFVDEGCDTLFAGGTAASSVIESIWANKGDCLTTNAKISKLVELFTESYEYQFDLMETLATAVRAYQSKFFAERLDTNLRVIGEQDISEESDNEAVNLNAAMLNFFLIYRMHTFQIIAQYCNYLEFKNAGELPSVCPNALETLEQRDISKLIAFTPATCTPESFKFVDIPTSNSDDDNENGYVDIEKLYTGEEVQFQIPNIAWLLKHNWITNADAKDTAIYVSAFELFLPGTESASSNRKNLLPKLNAISKENSKPFSSLSLKKNVLGKIDKVRLSRVLNDGVNLNVNARTRRSSTQDIRFQTTAKYSAPLFTEEESARFVLQPYRRYVFSYQENADSCRQDTIDNPYSSSLPEICPVSLKPEDNDVNPSIFSLWKIKLQSPEFESKPDDVADRSLKAAVRLCKVKKPSTVSKKKKNKKKSSKKEKSQN